MPEQADISVIIPVFNGANVIGKCLDALLDQTVKPREIIVVDNGSTDDTVALVRHYGGISILEESTAGAGIARNRGAGEATGSILAFIDADCQAEPDWIREAWRIMKHREKVHGLVGVSHGINKNLWAVFFQRSYDDFINEIQDLDGRLLKIDTKNFFIRRKVFQATNGFDKFIGNSEDVDLGIRLHLAGFRIEYATSVVVSHANPTSLSRQLRVRREQCFFDFVIFRKIPSGEGSKYYPAFKRSYSHYLFLRTPPPAKSFLLFLNFAIELNIGTCRFLLFFLPRLGLTTSLYSLFHLLMDFAAFQGKLYARRIEAGHMDLGELPDRRKFSRRLGELNLPFSNT